MEAEECSPILETALIANKMRAIFLLHENSSIPKAQGIRKAGFLCPPARSFIHCDRMKFLLASAPFNARDDVVEFILHGSLLCKVLSGCTVGKSIRERRERTTRRGPSSCGVGNLQEGLAHHAEGLNGGLHARVAHLPLSHRAHGEDVSGAIGGEPFGETMGQSDHADRAIGRIEQYIQDIQAAGVGQGGSESSLELSLALNACRHPRQSCRRSVHSAIRGRR